MASYSIKFTTDSEGFLSRECSSCKQTFKVQYGKGSDKAVAHCPYCKHSDKDDNWLTEAQAKYVGEVAAQQFLGPQIDKMFKGLKGMTVTSKRAPTPRVPAESNATMATLVFVCCGETIKHDSQVKNLFCPICGIVAPPD